MEANLAAVIIGAIMVAAPSFAAGWASGARIPNRRLKQQIAALNRYTDEYRKWQKSPPGTEYQRGYDNGVINILDTLDGFLDKASR